MTRRWTELSERTRRLIILGAAFEGVLKIAALIDIKRRPVSEIRGSKAKWAMAVVLVNSEGRIAQEGEICLDLAQRPLGLMQEYHDDAQRTARAMGDGYYHSGDVAVRDAEGYLTYVGRMDDVFKSSDYRISPFELESVLIEHDAVAEAAVVPSPDALRLSVPKAFVVLAAGASADAATAASILRHVRERVSPFKRIRRLEFASLPKTISGKIRRVELRELEQARPPSGTRRPQEFWEEDLST